MKVTFSIQQTIATLQQYNEQLKYQFNIDMTLMEMSQI